MDRERAPCLECAAVVPADANTCPACDYDLAVHDRRRLWFGALGTALTLSLVLAPLGLALLHSAWRHRLAAEGTVTRRAATPVGDDLEGSLAGFLSLDPHGGPSREFTRGHGPVEPGAVDASQR